MSFWANKIAQQQAPTPPAPATPWWMGQSQPAPVAPVVNQPGQQVPYGSGTTQPPPGQSDFGSLIRQENYQTTKARSSLGDDKGPCPDCGGPNYVGTPGSTDRMPHCYDCGYNPRFQQMTSGLTAGGGVKVEGPVRAARQQHATVSDFNPGHIINR